MTIIPKPIQKPLRRFEIIVGLLCTGCGGWVLLHLGSSLAKAPQLPGGLGWEAAWLLAKGIYLLGFGGALIRRGYLSMLLWALALATLLSIPITLRSFS